MGKDIYLLFDKSNKTSVKKADAIMATLPTDVVIYWCSSPDKWQLLKNAKEESLLIFPDSLSFQSFMSLNKSAISLKPHQSIITGRINQEVVPLINGRLDKNFFLLKDNNEVAKKVESFVNDKEYETVEKRKSLKAEKDDAHLLAEKALRKTLKELQKKNGELEKINFELDRFVYSVSHDLRAPLTSVLGLIHLLKEEVSGDNPQHYIALMIESIAKLDNTIKDILAYSRNNRMQVVKEEFNVRTVVSTILENLSYLNDTNFDVNKILVVRGKTVFKADKLRLQTILNNLLSNAIKYRNSQRPLKVEIDTSILKNSLILKIKDNGVGIEPKHIPYIFDMFFRTDERSNGSGLGLYIVKETILKLKGKITVNSTVGKGTEFIVTIPIN
jgi:signal transduction histidine kinase